MARRFVRQTTEERGKKNRKTDVAVISTRPGGGTAEADSGFHPPSSSSPSSSSSGPTQTNNPCQSVSERSVVGVQWLLSVSSSSSGSTQFALFVCCCWVRFVLIGLIIGL